LPTYPFARERYWFNTKGNGDLPAQSNATMALHPLLHRNTSVLDRQSYSTTFSGKEFFLSGHRIQGQKILPVTALLEMARAAIEKAMPPSRKSDVLELRNMEWVQPVDVAHNKQVTIALFENDENNDDEIEYEIYGTEGEEDQVYCRGQAVFNGSPASSKLDIEQLKGHHGQGALELSSLYSALTNMGMSYGPSFQGIKAIYQGDNQQLVQLSLPQAMENNYKDYFLHPSIMEGALQAAIGLVTGMNPLPDQPLFPYALESSKIVSPCAKEMYAWIRYSRGSKPGDRVLKLDIDLMDGLGKICVKLKSLAFSNNKFDLENKALRSDFESLLDSIGGFDENSLRIGNIENYTEVFEKILDSRN
jgi:acyl transferase domain-containing protein